ncbi:Arrestin family protein 1 [Golovinomyces cichoracearum]|uniref:Arrestin family protein 1 n=1 Tax=Golovinomyces cichoracearum TaxID=62708 RepID=A0A420HRR9_9PEZI|nr:Arrestin family protein 1 [Golovinomyces cichoracearum]
MAAFVRVSGPPNSNFLIGYPGISATLPRIEGRVEIRPLTGISAPVAISLVRICLLRRETIHPSAESIAKKHLGTPRKEISDLVGKELLLFRCSARKESESVVLMDLPFVLFIPFGREGQESHRRIPPASLQLPSRIAETFFELVVTVHQGQEQKKYAFPVPIQRYDTLSTFGMFNRPECAEKTSDHLITLGISLPRCSYGPMDLMSVYIKLSPNPDWIEKARKVVIQKITISIEEEITFNPEGDDPTRKCKEIAKHVQPVGARLPETGYFTNLGLAFPLKDPRDPLDGFIRRGKAAFPVHLVSSFTTSSTLYKIDFYLRVKAHLSGARHITLRHPILVCPLDHQDCKEEMNAIEQAAKDAATVDPLNPMLPAPTIVKANDPNALRCLGWAIVGGLHKMLIN